MHKLPCLLCALCLFLGCSDRGSKMIDIPDSTAKTADSTKQPSQRDDDAGRILTRAIVALGGDAAEEKLKNCKLTYHMTAAMPATAGNSGDETMLFEDSFCHPDKWKRICHYKSDGRFAMLFVLNGDHLWAKMPGKKVQEMPLPPMSMRKPSLLSTLSNLKEMRDSNASMVVGPPEELEGRPLIPLTVFSGGRPRNVTYFDPATHLIVAEVKYDVPAVIDPPETWRNRRVEMQTSYADHKCFEGVTVPTHAVTTQRGRTVFETSVQALEFPAQFDPHTFDKPKDE